MKPEQFQHDTIEMEVMYEVSIGETQVTLCVPMLTSHTIVSRETR